MSLILEFKAPLVFKWIPIGKVVTRTKVGEISENLRSEFLTSNVK